MERSEACAEAARGRAAGRADRDRTWSISCSPAYHDWVRDLSGRTLIPAAALARTALREWARAHGHAPPPAR